MTLKYPTPGGDIGWRQQQPDPFEGLDERGWQWIQARKQKLVEGKPRFDRPETEAVAQKMLELIKF